MCCGSADFYAQGYPREAKNQAELRIPSMWRDTPCALALAEVTSRLRILMEYAPIAISMRLPITSSHLRYSQVGVKKRTHSGAVAGENCVYG